MLKNSFEENLRCLWEIVQDLEDKDLSLEEAISHFEKGMNRVKACEEFLASARLRVEQLIVEVGGGYRIEEWKAGERGNRGTEEQR